MKNEKKKLDNIVFIKLIMMILVVFYHSLRYFTGDWFNIYNTAFVSNYALFITRFLKMFHVQTFCMTSGFLYFYLKIEKNKYDELKSSVLNKIKRLLIPFLSTCIFWAFPIGMYFYKYSVKEIIYKFVLMASPAQLWFLIALFNIFILFFMILYKVRFNYKNLILFYIISTIIGTSLELLGIHFFQLDTTIQYCLYFYFGGFIYMNREKISTKKIIIAIFIVIVLLVIRFAFYDYEGIIHYVMRFMEPIISLLEIFIIYYLCTYFIEKRKINNKIYSIISENSFGIYLFHQQIIYIIIAVFNRYVNSIILVLISFAVSLLFSIILCILLKRNKYTKIIFGL